VQVELRFWDMQALLPPHQPQPTLMLHSVQDNLNEGHASREGGAAVTGCAVVVTVLVMGAAEVLAALVANALVATFVVNGAISGQMEQAEGVQQEKKLVTAAENKLKGPKSCKQRAPPPRANCDQL
jgi:hypothetical protein